MKRRHYLVFFSISSYHSYLLRLVERVRTSFRVIIIAAGLLGTLMVYEKVIVRHLLCKEASTARRLGTASHTSFLSDAHHSLSISLSLSTENGRTSHLQLTTPHRRRQNGMLFKSCLPQPISMDGLRCGAK